MKKKVSALVAVTFMFLSSTAFGQSHHDESIRIFSDVKGVLSISAGDGIRQDILDVLDQELHLLEAQPVPENVLEITGTGSVIPGFAAGGWWSEIEVSSASGTTMHLENPEKPTSVRHISVSGAFYTSGRFGYLRDVPYDEIGQVFLSGDEVIINVSFGYNDPWIYESEGFYDVINQRFFTGNIVFDSPVEYRILRYLQGALHPRDLSIAELPVFFVHMPGSSVVFWAGEFMASEAWEAPFRNAPVLEFRGSENNTNGDSMSIDMLGPFYVYFEGRVVEMSGQELRNTSFYLNPNGRTPIGIITRTDKALLLEGSIRFPGGIENGESFLTYEPRVGYAYLPFLAEGREGDGRDQYEHE